MVKEEIRLTRILRRGSTGDDVKKLQKFLKQFSDVYPEGLTTGYYGSLTEAAVKKFQLKQGIVTDGDPDTTGFGQVSPKTISKLNEVINDNTENMRTEAIQTPSGTIPAVPAQPIGFTGTTTTSAVPAQSATTTQEECVSAGLFWYTVSCHPNPSLQESCTASYNYCAGSTECSTNGWYWCRNSCYGSADACLDQPFVPPAVPVTPTPIPTPTPTPTPTPIPTPTSSPSTIDITPTTISNIQTINITETSATITWTTNELASSGVDYSMYSMTIATTTIKAIGADNVTDHSVSLYGLSSSKIYYYVVVSKDNSGNTATSSEQLFTTLTPPPPTPTQSQTRIKSVITDDRIWNPESIFISGHYAYVAAFYASRLTIVDIANPSNPQIVGSVYDANLMSSVTSVTVSGNYAYVTARASNRLTIIDISNPNEPLIVGSVQSDSNFAGASSVQVSGTRAYVASYRRLTIVDVSNPNSPAITGSVYDGVNFVGGAYSVDVAGNYAYVTGGNGYVAAVDISNPSAPVIIGSLTNTDKLRGARSIRVSGNYAYVAAYNTTCFVIINISNPSSLSISGFICDPNQLNGPNQISVYNNHAYITVSDTASLPVTGNGRLIVVNVENPNNPFISGSVTSSGNEIGSPRGISVSENYAYIGNSYSGMAIIDISGL